MLKFLFFVICICGKGYCDHLQLNITHRQSVCIDTIIYSLGEKSTGSLMFNAFQLRSMGKEIEQVHPLEFLTYICKKPRIFNYLKDTRGRYFQWNAFISGFSDKCNNANEYTRIREDLEAFAEGLDLDVYDLWPFVQSKDWKGFVNYLLTRR